MTQEDAQSLTAFVLKWALEVGNSLTLCFNSLNTPAQLVHLPGHATVGGLGPNSRQWGSTLDHIREVEVVLADGTITRANETQNTDLYFVCDYPRLVALKISLPLPRLFVGLLHPLISSLSSCSKLTQNPARLFIIPLPSSPSILFYALDGLRV